MKPSFILLFFLVFLLGGCTSPHADLVEEAPFISKSFTDDLDRTVTLSESPSKIVVLSPGIVEMVYAIGGEDLVIARGENCLYPEWVEEKPAIPFFPQLNRDSLLSFQPDLILAMSRSVFLSEQAFLEEKKQNLYYQEILSLDDLYRNIRNLGALIDREEAANHLADSLALIEQKIIAETEDEIKYGSAFLLDPELLTVVGGGSIMSDLIEKAGGKNVFGTDSSQYFISSEDQMMKAGIEYLFIPSEGVGQSGLNEMTSNYPRLALLPAVQLGQVYEIPMELVFNAGPRSLEGLSMMTRILHSSIDTESFFEPETDEDDDEDWEVKWVE